MLAAAPDCRASDPLYSSQPIYLYDERLSKIVALFLRQPTRHVDEKMLLDAGARWFPRHFASVTNER